MPIPQQETLRPDVLSSGDPVPPPQLDISAAGLHLTGGADLGTQPPAPGPEVPQRARPPGAGPEPPRDRRPGSWTRRLGLSATSATALCASQASPGARGRRPPGGLPGPAPDSSRPAEPLRSGCRATSLLQKLMKCHRRRGCLEHGPPDHEVRGPVFHRLLGRGYSRLIPLAASDPRRMPGTTIRPRSP